MAEFWSKIEIMFWRYDDFVFLICVFLSKAPQSGEPANALDQKRISTNNSSQDRRKINQNSNKHLSKIDCKSFKKSWKNIQRIHYLRAKLASKRVHVWRIFEVPKGSKTAPNTVPCWPSNMGSCRRLTWDQHEDKLGLKKLILGEARVAKSPPNMEANLASKIF